MPNEHVAFTFDREAAAPVPRKLSEITDAEIEQIFRDNPDIRELAEKIVRGGGEGPGLGGVTAPRDNPSRPPQGTIALEEPKNTEF